VNVHRFATVEAEKEDTISSKVVKNGRHLCNICHNTVSLRLPASDVEPVRDVDVCAPEVQEIGPRVRCDLPAKVLK
jgi:hypothetical protein